MAAQAPQLHDIQITDPDPQPQQSQDPQHQPPATLPDPASVGQDTEVATLRAELKELRESIQNQRTTQSGHTDELIERLLQQTQPSLAAEPAVEDVSDEELEQMLANGTGAATLRKLVSNATARERRDLEKRIGELETFGLSQLSDITSEITQAKMPLLKEDPEIKKIFDNDLKQADPRLRAEPKFQRAVYSRIVGENMDRILDRKLEERIRQLREPADPSLPGANNGRTNQQQTRPGVQTVEEFCGTETARMMKQNGWTPDGVAQKLGYESWEDYVKMAEDLPEGPYVM